MTTAAQYPAATAKPSPLGQLATWNADKLWQRKPPTWAKASWAKAAAR